MISDKDKKIMDIALDTAKLSDDDNTKVGCVIVSPNGTQAVRGFNHYMIGLKRTEERTSQPNKYHYFVHAEEHAIHEMIAAHEQFNSSKSTAYVTLFPCSRCFRQLAYAGVVRVVVGHDDNFDEYPSQYMDDVAAVKAIAKDLGIKIDFFPK